MTPRNEHIFEALYINYSNLCSPSAAKFKRCSKSFETPLRAYSLFRKYALFSIFLKKLCLHLSFSENKLPIATDTFPFSKSFVEATFLLNVLPFLFGFVPCRYRYKTQFCITHSRTCFFSNPEHSKQCFFIAFNGVTFILFPSFFIIL